jgi:hypothetical protein
MRALLLIGLCLSLSCAPARAFDHGFDPNDPVVKWFESLQLPDDRPKRCCGKGDAYKIQIVRDALGERDDEMGEAVITDGAAIEFPDGTRRLELPNGLRFRFPKSKLNPLSDGNPTDTAWVFVAIRTGPPNEITKIYCVIPLPPGF